MLHNIIQCFGLLIWYQPPSPHPHTHINNPGICYSLHYATLKSHTKCKNMPKSPNKLIYILLHKHLSCPFLASFPIIISRASSLLMINQGLVLKKMHSMSRKKSLWSKVDHSSTWSVNVSLCWIRMSYWKHESMLKPLWKLLYQAPNLTLLWVT